MVKSTGKVIAGTAKFAGRALMQVGLTFKWAGELITGQSTVRTQRLMIQIDDQQREVVGQGLQVGKFLGTLLLDTAVIFPKVEMGLLIGDMDMIRTALHGSETHRMIFSMAAEAITATMQELRTGKPGQQGYMIGKIVFEVASIILPQTKLGKIAEVTKSRVLARLLGKKNVLPPGARQVAGEIKDVVDASQMCFVAGTLVLTKSGWMRIEEVRVGMWVWSRDEHTGATGWKRVRHTFTTHPTELYRLTYELRGPPGSEGNADIPVRPVSSETLGVTAPHPFWVSNREQPAFIEAEKLQAGDELLTADGRKAVVMSKVLEEASAGRTFTTYNFEVEDFHTYFAGQNAVWVHNHSLRPCQLARATIKSLVEKGDQTTWDAFRGTLTKVSYDDIGHRTRLQIFNEARQKYLTDATWNNGTPPWDASLRNVQTIGAKADGTTLGRNMKKVGIEAPWKEGSTMVQAHHIVPGADKRYQSAIKARKLLDDASIDINEAANGCFLPSKAEFSDLGKAIHSGSPPDPKKYSDWVFERLEPHANNPDALRRELQLIANDLVEVGWPQS